MHQKVSSLGGRGWNDSLSLEKQPGLRLLLFCEGRMCQNIMLFRSTGTKLLVSLCTKNYAISSGNSPLEVEGKEEWGKRQLRQKSSL